ncbi:hypothetical protein MnTg02_01017 [bacterium MnTg02]|nr:hypothetical protein MnTg02_01017 [bacterium MnTg02]
MSRAIFGPSGGVGGHPFDDEPYLEHARLSEIRVWSGYAINAVQLLFDIDGDAVESRKHGGHSGSIGTLRLDDGEYLTEIYGRYGSYVESLCLRTNRGQIRRFGGQGGSNEFVYLAPQGFQITGFWGCAGEMIDSIGVHIAPVSVASDH